MVTVLASILVAIAGSVSAEPATPAPAPQPASPAPAGSPSQAEPTGPTSGPGATPATGEKPAATESDAFVLGFTVKDIDGNDVDLSKYKGQVVMIVNVASKCGYTPQYAGLEKLYKDRAGKGFVILGFPANDFGEQEPGTNSEIKTFCSSKYNVTFPMFAKISVRGSEQHPLFKKLSSQPKPLGGEGVPGWNFTKFLVDRNGNVVARFDSKVKPDDATLVKRVDELVAGK